MYPRKKVDKKKEDMKMGNWENNIRKVVPYTPGEQPNQTDMIKLNTNEILIRRHRGLRRYFGIQIQMH